MSCSAVGTRMLIQHRQWGIDRDVAVIRVDADKDEPARLHKPAVALIGDAKPILARLVDELSKHNTKRASRRAEMQERQAAWRGKLRDGIGPQMAFLDAIRDELPEDGIFVDEVTQIGFAARLALPVYKPRTFLSPGYQDNLGWGFATALGVQDARRDVPVLSISGDGGFLYTANELATAVRHRIPLTTIVFVDGAFGNVRRIQQEHYGNRVIASDLANPDFVRFAESFGAAAERVRTPEELRGALRRGLRAARRADRDRGSGWALPLALAVPPHAAGPRLTNRRTPLASNCSNVLDPSLTFTRPVSPFGSCARSPHGTDQNDERAGRRLRAPCASTRSSRSTPSSCAKPPIIRCSASRNWRARTKPWWSTRWRPASTSRRSST